MVTECRVTFYCCAFCFYPLHATSHACQVTAFSAHVITFISIIIMPCSHEIYCTSSDTKPHLSSSLQIDVSLINGTSPHMDPIQEKHEAQTSAGQLSLWAVFTEYIAVTPNIKITCYCNVHNKISPHISSSSLTVLTNRLKNTNPLQTGPGSNLLICTLIITERLNSTRFAHFSSSSCLIYNNFTEI